MIRTTSALGTEWKNKQVEARVEFYHSATHSMFFLIDYVTPFLQLYVHIYRWCMYTFGP